MTFHFDTRPFWGVLVLPFAGHASAPLRPSHNKRSRLRIVAHWERTSDGRLERHWQKEPARLSSI